MAERAVFGHLRITWHKTNQEKRSDVSSRMKGAVETEMHL